MAVDSPMVVVLPFFRAHFALRASDQTLFDPALDDEAFLTTLAASPLVFRHNVQRLLIASERAKAENAPIVLAEGWRKNQLAPDAEPVTGAEAASHILTLLQQRKLTAFDGTIHRLDISCCTWQEIACVAEAFPGARIVGVTSSPCPSAARARRIMRLQALPSPEVISSSPTLRPPQQAVYNACAVPRGVLTEAINWGVHFVSEIERVIRRPAIPFEMRFAKKLRR